MTFGINTYSMNRLHSYAQAHDYFNKTDKPRTKRWSADRRPLRDTRSTHMAVQQSEHLGVPCYDMVLYDTALIRYFEPNAQGEYAVWLQNYSTQSTQRFMWANGWYSGLKLVDENNQACHAIVSTEANLPLQLWGDQFTCKMVFDRNDRLIRERSMHIPGFKRSSTATMRARRKILKQKIEVMLNMLEMQFTSLSSDLYYDIWEGHGVGRNTPNFPLLEHAIRGVQMLEKGGNPNDDDMTRLVEYMRFSAKQVMENTVNRRLSAKYVDPRRWHTLLEDAPENDAGHISDLTPSDRELAMPTADAVLKAVFGRVMMLAGLHADTRVPMPQFPTERPQTFLSSGKYADPVNLLGADLYHKLVSRKGVIY